MVIVLLLRSAIKSEFENGSQQAQLWATYWHKVLRNISLLFSQRGVVSKLFPMLKVLLTYQMVKTLFLFSTRMQQKMIQYLKRYFGLFKILKFILQELTIWWILWTNIIISFVRHMPHREVSRRKLMMDVYQCSHLRPPGVPRGQRSAADLTTGLNTEKFQKSHFYNMTFAIFRKWLFSWKI